MIDCDRLRAEAPGLASLPPEDPERIAAWAHAASCEGCARALREAERLQVLLGEWSPPLLTAAAYGRTALAVEAELGREARRRAAWPMVAAAGLMAAMVAMARHPGGSALDWGTAAVLGALALGLLALAGRMPGLVVAVAAASAVAAALVVGRAGPIEPGQGAECLLWELGAAALVVGAGRLALRGSATSPARSVVAAAAASGALAGDAALQVTCAAHGVGPHLLAFHAGGVLLAALVAGLLWRGRGRSAAA